MTINVFGVGRSGTKALQLYLSYHIALNEEDLWINYEPYCWFDRTCIFKNYEGLHCHNQVPLILNKNEKSGKIHTAFLKKLLHDKYSTVNKFIRGSGRIHQINDITQPDTTIIIIRDIYEVLQSLNQQNWDFLGKGWNTKNDWKELWQQASKIISKTELKWIKKNISSLDHQNAFYWYINNLYLLKHPPKNSIICRFRELKTKVEQFVKSSFQKYETLSQPKFIGKNLHTQHPLSSPQVKSIKHRINLKLEQSGIFNTLNLYLKHDKYGGPAQISSQKSELKSSSNTFFSNKETKPTFRSDKLLQHFSSIINSFLDDMTK